VAADSGRDIRQDPALSKTFSTLEYVFLPYKSGNIVLLRTEEIDRGFYLVTIAKIYSESILGSDWWWTFHDRDRSLTSIPNLH
jgi:hypothetical protein